MLASPGLPASRVKCFGWGKACAYRNEVTPWYSCTSSLLFSGEDTSRSEKWPIEYGRSSFSTSSLTLNYCPLTSTPSFIVTLAMKM